MTIRFFLKSAQKGKVVPVWVRVKDAHFVDIQSSLPKDKASLKPEDWNAKSNKPVVPNQDKEPERFERLSSVTTYLQVLEAEITKAIGSCKDRGEAFTIDKLQKIAGKKTRKSNKAPRDIMRYCNWLIGRMETGDFLNGSARYDYDTIKTWKVFSHVLEAFVAEYEEKTAEPLIWASIDKKAFDAFVGFIAARGYTPKSQNKLIICLKALIKYAAVYDNLHDNLICLKAMRRVKEVAGTAVAKVYLNAQEVQALYEMQLEPGSLKDQVRDIFLIGCYTGQRVSDYTRLTKDNFVTTTKGTKIVRLVQEKTDNEVWVPVLNDNLMRIAEKYDYNFPRIGSMREGSSGDNADVLINRYIKQICKELSESVPSLKEPVKTILTLSERRAEEAGTKQFERDETGNVIKPKYEMIVTHCARRSCITNLHKTGLFTTAQLMSISGHKTESVFYEYLSQSAAEIADEIAAKMEAARAQSEASSNKQLFV